LLHLLGGLRGHPAALHLRHVHFKSGFAFEIGEFAGHGHAVAGGTTGGLHFEVGREGGVFTKNFRHVTAQSRA
jgi:hypothetical protein